jgi:hypothetical protein
MERVTFSFSAMKETNPQWVMHSDGMSFGSQAPEFTELHMKIEGVWKVFHFTDDSRDEMVFVRDSVAKEVDEWEYYINFQEPELMEEFEVTYPPVSPIRFVEDDSLPF